MILEFELVIDKFEEICRASALVLHEDVYSDESIPEKKINKTYMISIGEITSVTATQNQNIVSIPVTVSVYAGPGRANVEPLKSCLKMGQDIIQRAMHPRIRQNFMDIQLTGFTNEPRSEDNSNIVKGIIGFNVLMPLSI